MRWIVPNGKVVTIEPDTTIDLASLPPGFAHLRDDRPRAHEPGYLDWLDQVRENAGRRPLPRGEER